MKTYKIYPAVFEQDGAGYMVSFPDLPGCYTQGDTITEAYKNSREALSLYLDELSGPPTPSDIRRMTAPDGGYIMLVEADPADNVEYFKQEDVPRVIAEALVTHGFTKYKVAKILGVSESYVSRIAKGERRPSPEMAKRFGELLNIDWQLFFS